MAREEEFERTVKRDIESRVREGVKPVLEEVLKEEITEHLKAGYRELTPTRRGERNDRYTPNLVTPAGRIERLEVPRDREGEFISEVFERYKRGTGNGDPGPAHAAEVVRKVYEAAALRAVYRTVTLSYRRSPSEISYLPLGGSRRLR